MDDTTKDGEIAKMRLEITELQKQIDQLKYAPLL